MANSGQFQPGHERLGGRKAGQPNKTTIAVKQALEEAFQQLGGVPSLVAWGREDPHGFYSTWAKLLPKDATLSTEGEIKIIVKTGVPDSERAK